jgi:hypothetical protein
MGYKLTHHFLIWGLISLLSACDVGLTTSIEKVDVREDESGDPSTVSELSTEPATEPATEPTTEPTTEQQLNQQLNQQLSHLLIQLMVMDILPVKNVMITTLIFTPVP